MATQVAVSLNDVKAPQPPVPSLRRVGEQPPHLRDHLLPVEVHLRPGARTPPTGLRVTQLSLLTKLQRSRPLTINVLAEELVMDRTTLGRNIQPLEREGLIAVKAGRAARRAWAKAQARFESVFGDDRASELRTILRAVSASDLGATARAPIR